MEQITISKKVYDEMVLEIKSLKEKLDKIFGKPDSPSLGNIIQFLRDDSENRKLAVENGIKNNLDYTDMARCRLLSTRARNLIENAFCSGNYSAKTPVLFVDWDVENGCGETVKAEIISVFTLQPLKPSLTKKQKDRILAEIPKNYGSNKKTTK